VSKREVYLVDESRIKHLITGIDTLAGLGYDIADIEMVSESEMISYKRGEDLTIGAMSLANKEKFRKHYIPSSSGASTMKAEMNPYYSGTKCYENSIFPPEHCDFRLSGFCSTHFLSCAMWESCKFLVPPSTTSTSELYETVRASKCSNYYSGKFEYGKWVSDDCPVTWFTPEELR